MKKSVFTAEYQILRTLLRSVRERSNVTQVELAEKLDETQSFVSKCERGERRLDVVQLNAFCEALGIELIDFVKEFTSLTQGHSSRSSPKTRERRS